MADRFYLLNGCAGSKKTSKLINLCKKYNEQNKNVLFITTTNNSVYNLKKKLQNIDICNYDSFICNQLLYYNDDTIDDICFNKKCEYYFNQYVMNNCDKFVNKQGEIIDVIIIDEIQDLTNIKMQIIIQVVRRNNIIVIAAGDILQTIFETSIDYDILHPILLWKKELNNKIKNLRKNYRNPKPHIDFVNMLMKDYYKKILIKPMLSRSGNILEKPILFYHPAISKNYTSQIVSNQILESIKILYQNDNQFHPRKVGIIMTKCNENALFGYIEYQLNLQYTQWGFNNSVIILDTNKGNINWDLTQNKTTLMSIHAAKGQEYEIVFFLGFTEGSIPNDNHLYKPQELLDRSLMNIALTRSTKWLFVGFTQSMMSRYLLNNYHKLHEYSILTWDSQTWETPIMRNICQNINNVYANKLPDYQKGPWLSNPHYKKKPIFRPDKLLLTIKYDIAYTYEDITEIINKKIPCTCYTFGFPYFPEIYHRDLYPIFGNMGELILEREYYIYHQKYDEFLTKFNYLKILNIYYTDDERLLSILQDEQYNYKIKLGYDINIKSIFDKYEDYIKINSDLEYECNKILESNYNYILPKVFESEEFKNSINKFLQNINSNEIETQVFWNIAIYNTIIDDELRKPIISLYLNYYNQNISGLINNIQKFIKDKNNLSFHNKHNLTDVETDSKMLESMGYSDSITFGIIGESDILDLDTNILYEIKCPITIEYNRKWLIQTLLYACLTNVNIIRIVNIIEGRYYEYNISKINRRKILKKILKKKKYRNRHIMNLITKI